MEEHRKVGNYTVFPFTVDDVIDRDKKNVLSSTSVFGKDGTIITNIIISPLAEKTEKDIVEQAMERCKKQLPKEVADAVKISIFRNIYDFPLTGSGKRNIRVLEEMDFQ